MGPLVCNGAPVSFSLRRGLLIESARHLTPERAAVRPFSLLACRRRGMKLSFAEESIMNARRSGYRIMLPAVGLAGVFLAAGLSRPQEAQPPKPARESSGVRGPSAADVAPAPERLTSKPCPEAA